MTRKVTVTTHSTHVYITTTPLQSSDPGHGCSDPYTDSSGLMYKRSSPTEITVTEAAPVFMGQVRQCVGVCVCVCVYCCYYRCGLFVC